MSSKMAYSKKQKNLEECKQTLEKLIEKQTDIDQQFCCDLKAAFEQLGITRLLLALHFLP